MKLLKRNIQIGFVLLLSLFFVYCSSNNDLLFDDDGDLKIEAPHKYDIKFTRGDETIHYTGSVGVDDAIAMAGRATGSTSITLSIEDDHVTINGTFMLDEKGVPYSFDMNENDPGNSSFLIIEDSKKNHNVTSKSGNLTIKNFKTYGNSGGAIALSSFTLEFNGEFILHKSGSTVPYSAKGKLVMSPYK